MNAIIVGGTSGIGRALAEVFLTHGHATAITGRRENLLEQFRAAHDGALTERMDVNDRQAAQLALLRLIKRMGGADVIVLCAGTGDINTKLDWGTESRTIETNALSFAALACTAYKYFADRGSGQLAGISSVAAVRGSGRAPAYGASKAFVSHYLQALRYNAAYLRLPITVTDIRPGFVATDMMKVKTPFWVATPQKAVEQIYGAILKKKKLAYITPRWRLAAWLIAALPDFIYEKI